MHKCAGGHTHCQRVLTKSSDERDVCSIAEVLCTSSQIEKQPIILIVEQLGVIVNVVHILALFVEALIWSLQAN